MQTKDPLGKKRTDILPYMLLLPTLLVVGGFVLYPLVSNIVMSFRDAKLIKATSQFIGFANYATILASPRIWESIARTFVWTIINIFFMSIIGLVTALLFTAEFHGKNFLKMVILIPWVLPQVVSGFTWNVMLSDNMGIITAFLRASGLCSPDFSWFQTGSMAMASAILANVWRGYPFFALMLYAKIKTLPREQIEAARIDGASGTRLFLSIMFPHIKVVLFTCMSLAFLWTYNAYDIIKVMTDGGPADATLTLPLLIQREAFEYYNLSTASTMSIVTFIIIIILVALYSAAVSIAKRREA